MNTPTLPDACFARETFVNYYELLGVTTRASPDDIRAAFRHRAFELHPDRCSEAGADGRFKMCTDAAEVLGSSLLRREYNSLLAEFTVDALPPSLFAFGTSSGPAFSAAVASVIKNTRGTLAAEAAIAHSLTCDTASVYEGERVESRNVTLEDVALGTTFSDGTKVPRGVCDHTRIFSPDGKSMYVVRVLPHAQFVRGGALPGTTVSDLISFCSVPADAVARRFARGSVTDLAGQRRLWNVAGPEAAAVFAAAAAAKESRRSGVGMPYVRIRGAGLPSIIPQCAPGDIIIEIAVHSCEPQEPDSKMLRVTFHD
jgi:hypothetical protein